MPTTQVLVLRNEAMQEEPSCWSQNNFDRSRCSGGPHRSADVHSVLRSPIDRRTA